MTGITTTRITRLSRDREEGSRPRIFAERGMRENGAAAARYGRPSTGMNAEVGGEKRSTAFDINIDNDRFLISIFV